MGRSIESWDCCDSDAMMDSYRLERMIYKKVDRDEAGKEDKRQRQRDKGKTILNKGRRIFYLSKRGSNQFLV